MQWATARWCLSPPPFPSLWKINRKKKILLKQSTRKAWCFKNLCLKQRLVFQGRKEGKHRERQMTHQSINVLRYQPEWRTMSGSLRQRSGDLGPSRVSAGDLQRAGSIRRRGPGLPGPVGVWGRPGLLHFTDRRHPRRVLAGPVCSPRAHPPAPGRISEQFIPQISDPRVESSTQRQVK